MPCAEPSYHTLQGHVVPGTTLAEIWWSRPSHLILQFCHCLHCLHIFLECGSADDTHFQHAMAMFHSQISLPKCHNSSVCSGLYHPPEGLVWRREMTNPSTPANRFHLLSETSLHAAYWLSMAPSASVGLHLESNDTRRPLCGAH